MLQLQQILVENTTEFIPTKTVLNLVTNLRSLESSITTLIVIEQDNKFTLLSLKTDESKTYFVQSTNVDQLILKLKSEYDVKVVLKDFENSYDFNATLKNQRVNANFTNEDLLTQTIEDFGSQTSFVELYTYSSQFDGTNLYDITKNLNVGRITNATLRTHSLAQFHTFTHKFNNDELIWKHKKVETLNLNAIATLDSIKTNIRKVNQVVTRRFYTLFEIFTNENLMFVFNKIEDSDLKYKTLTTALNSFKLIIGNEIKLVNGEEITKRNQKKYDKLIDILTSEKKQKNLIAEIIDIVLFLKDQNWIDRLYFNNDNYIDNLINFNEILQTQSNDSWDFNTFFEQNNLHTTFYENITELAKINNDTLVDVTNVESELKMAQNILTLFNKCFYVLES